MMDTINRTELAALEVAPDATHVLFNQDGSVYFCASLKAPDEEREDDFWRARGYTMKKVVDGTILRQSPAGAQAEGAQPPKG